jgi:hypothetical protein
MEVWKGREAQASSCWWIGGRRLRDGSLEGYSLIPAVRTEFDHDHTTRLDQLDRSSGLTTSETGNSAATNLAAQRSYAMMTRPSCGMT